MGLSFNGRTNRSRRLNPSSILGGSILQLSLEKRVLGVRETKIASPRQLMLSGTPILANCSVRFPGVHNMAKKKIPAS